jgi:hypothetical protein
MTNFEQELKDALRRRQPPAGFAERVLQRTADRRRPPAWRAGHLAAAAVVVAAIGGGTIAYESIRSVRAEREAGEAARDQVMVALEIAGSKLQLVQMKVNRVGRAPRTDRNP